MNMSQSRFFCTECGNEGLPIMRPKGQMREPGHACLGSLLYPAPLDEITSKEKTVIKAV